MLGVDIIHALMDIYLNLFNCKAWQREQAEILKTCEEDAGFSLSTVRQLLASRKMTKAVPDFLTIIRVDQRPKIEEHKEEEQRRHKDNAWDLKEDRLERDEDEDGDRQGLEREGGEREEGGS